MNYIFHILIIVCLYVVLAQSLNLVMGLGGMLSLCQAAFYGMGAYVSTLLVMNAHWPFLLSLCAAVVSAALFAWLVALLATRLHGDFFVLATLGFQAIVFSILYNWVDVTKGPYGIPGVPRPSIFGMSVSTPLAFFILALLTAILCCGLIWWLITSPYGRVLQAVREDEVAAKSLGKNVDALKRSVFTWAGAIAAVPGVVFASYSSYIDPTSFGLEESIQILCMLVIGGTGNFRGPFIGAAVLVLFPECLRFMNVPSNIAPNLRLILYCLAIIVVMRVRPQGIAGQYAFE